MPPPKDPIKYQEYLKKQSESRKGKFKEKSSHWKGGPKSKICEYCGEKYISTQRGKGGEKQRFCSTECKINMIDVWNKGLTAKIDERILSGDTHPMYIDGRSFLPYCFKFNKELKELIRNRDNRTCQYCSQKENDEKLCVHHIHYDKENCNPDLIALCRICNIKANTNRKQWEIIFMNKLNDRELLFWKMSD